MEVGGPYRLLPSEVETLYIHGVALRADLKKSRTLYRDFFPKLLANGSYRALPIPQIAGRGLERVQEATYLRRQGVSAREMALTLLSSDEEP